MSRLFDNHAEKMTGERRVINNQYCCHFRFHAVKDPVTDFPYPFFDFTGIGTNSGIVAAGDS
jgi:hypothetical protein